RGRVDRLVTTAVSASPLSAALTGTKSWTAPLHWCSVGGPRVTAPRRSGARHDSLQAMAAVQQRIARAPGIAPAMPHPDGAPAPLPRGQGRAAGTHPRSPRPSEARPRGATSVAPVRDRLPQHAARTRRISRTPALPDPNITSATADLEGDSPCSTPIIDTPTARSSIWSCSATRARACGTSPAPPAPRSTPPPGRTGTSTPSSRWTCPPPRTSHGAIARSDADGWPAPPPDRYRPSPVGEPLRPPGPLPGAPWGSPRCDRDCPRVSRRSTVRSGSTRRRVERTSAMLTTPPLDTDVLVVGAGPTGLMAGLVLQRRGADALVIDGKPGPTRESRAIVVQARSMAIYDRLGLAEQGPAPADPARRLRFAPDAPTADGPGEPGVDDGADGPAGADFAAAQTGRTPFPGAQIFEQSRNEELLARTLADAGR